MPPLFFYNLYGYDDVQEVVRIHMAIVLNGFSLFTLFVLNIKAGESCGRAPGQASDYALRAANPLGSSAMTRCFIKFRALKPVRAPGILPPPPSRRPC